VFARDVFPRSGARRLLATAALCALTAAAACYNPHVESGRLKCAPTSGQCPDGFTCVGEFCVSNSGTGMGGTGGSSCANPIVPLCTPVQTSDVCDPVCQTGCPCGQRCQLSAGGLKCAAPAGGLTAGMVCTPEADACAPGLTCLQEACGNDLGRCYRFCRDASVCSGTGVCGTPVLLPDRSDSLQRVCDLGGQACDPYAGTGCVDPALRCYVLGPTQRTCDCPSGVNAPAGASCGYNDCAAGLACLQIGAGGANRCVKLCESAADCPDSTCDPFGDTFGFCALAN
jgi:hypothetical protein